MHRDGLSICPNLSDSTQFQQAFLSIMASKDIGFEENLDMKVKALCEANGVKFKRKRGEIRVGREKN